MNEIKSQPRSKSIDTVWGENLKKLEGPLGIQILVNDNPALFSRLIKALKDRESLPCDMDNPESMTQVEAVNDWASAGYDIACEIAGVFEEMMVGDEVERAYENIMEESGETMSHQDKMRDYGLKESDF